MTWRNDEYNWTQVRLRSRDAETDFCIESRKRIGWGGEGRREVWSLLRKTCTQATAAADGRASRAGLVRRKIGILGVEERRCTQRGKRADCVCSDPDDACAEHRVVFDGKLGFRRQNSRADSWDSRAWLENVSHPPEAMPSLD